MVDWRLAIGAAASIPRSVVALFPLLLAFVAWWLRGLGAFLPLPCPLDPSPPAARRSLAVAVLLAHSFQSFVPSCLRVFVPAQFNHPLNQSIEGIRAALRFVALD